jgi:hypothetical protein
MQMSGLRKRLAKWATITFVLLSSELLAGEAPRGVMVIVADDRRFTGLRAWWANLYNESHLYFTLMTVILVPCAGALLGTAADMVMSRIGIDLKSRSIKES